MARRRTWYDEQRSSYLTEKFEAFVDDARTDGHDILHWSGDSGDRNPYDRLDASVGTTRFTLYVLAEVRSERNSIVLERWTQRHGSERVAIPGVSDLNAESIDASLAALAKHLVNAS